MAVPRLRDPRVLLQLVLNSCWYPKVQTLENYGKGFCGLPQLWDSKQGQSREVSNVSLPIDGKILAILYILGMKYHERHHCLKLCCAILCLLSSVCVFVVPWLDHPNLPCRPWDRRDQCQCRELHESRFEDRVETVEVTGWCHRNTYGNPKRNQKERKVYV